MHPKSKNEGQPKCVTSTRSHLKRKNIKEGSQEEKLKEEKTTSSSLLSNFNLDPRP
jgi:hypothetical protein